MKILKSLILVIFGSFLITANVVVWAAVNPVPLATNSPYKNGINDSCGGCIGGRTCVTSGSSSICCNSGYVNCSGSCVYLNSDVNNCGACGNACGKTQSCDSSACVDCTKDSECAPGESCCSGTCQASCTGGEAANGDPCSANTDCASRYCAAGKDTCDNCSGNGNCDSGNCNAGVCLRVIGDACAGDSDCDSGSCKAGECS